MTLSDELKARQAKLQALKKLGIKVYPAKFDINTNIKKLQALKKDNLPDLVKVKTELKNTHKIAGRVMTWRKHGKIIFAHFPITVKTKDKEILVENFQGERAPRIARIHGATKVVSKGDEVVITGPVLTEVSQTAAEIKQKTRIKNKDHRVFPDGIYIESKSKGITNKK